MAQELETATSDGIKSGIQHQLEEAEGEIRKWKEELNKHQSDADRYEDNLQSLKKEGEF